MENFAFVQHLLSTLVISLFVIIWGLAAVPGMALMIFLFELSQGYTLWSQALVLGLGGGASYLLWGLTNFLIIGAIGTLIRPRLPDARVPLKSMLTVRWAFLSLLHRLAQPFLKQVIPSWIANAYYSSMGCNISSGVQINTSELNDCFMVSIGKDTVIGGKAAINGHVVEKDELVLAPVTIGSGCVIGASSLILPGCKIGDGAVLAGKAVLPKYTEIPAGEIWGGVPAKCIRLADGSKPQ
ncbi:MAG: hypothetical protein H8D82_00480 [Euryarchaeota archaeon]|nr:hypothetical protein [Euryarchaeota archaeon]